MEHKRERETFKTRLGFLLIAAGCAIGLGNVWRFPYIAGQYGGAAFVLPYLGFLLFLGLPVLMAELAIGRGGKSGVGMAFDRLEKQGTKWHWAKFPLIASNYILMAFYSVVTGWMFYYFYKMLTDGEFLKGTPDQIASGFGEMLSNPPLLIFWMTVAIVLGQSRPMMVVSQTALTSCFGAGGAGLKKSRFMASLGRVFVVFGR